MLGKPKSMHNRVIINSHVQHPAIFRVQKAGNIFHHYGTDVVRYDVFVVLELVMAILDQR